MSSANRHLNRRRAALALLVAAVAAILVVLGLSATGKSSKGAPARWRPPASLENLMHLIPTPPRQAPSFSLTDQNGRSVSLGDLRGKVIVIEAMDPKCTDLCPIVSQDFLDADRVLGPTASRVAFVGINVNQFHSGVSDVLSFSRMHRLETLPNWHFLTGPTRRLQQVWNSYEITVEPNRTGDVVHSGVMEFVDPEGQARWIAAPDYNKAAISEWGNGIAAVARHLLN